MKTSGPSPLVLKAGNFFFRTRNLLFPAMFLLLFVVSEPNSLLPESLPENALDLAGVLLVVLGQSFRLLVIGYAYIKRGGKEGKVFADKLVIRGFYAHTRNPMYLGNAAIVLGLCLVYQSFWAYALVLPFFLFAYYAIVVAEETYLSARFGAEYDRYVQTVNRFIPDFRGLRASLVEFRYDWRRALRKDYGNVTLAAMTLLVIGAREGMGRRRLLAGFVATISFYCLARYLKKTGRLSSSN